MKKILFFLLVLLLPGIPAMAGEFCGGSGCCFSNQASFGGLVTRFTQLDGQAAVQMGGRGLWKFSDRFGIGGGGYGQIGSVAYNSDAFPELYKKSLTLGYGGMYMEYSFIHKPAFSMQLAGMLGGGGFNINGEDGGSLFIGEPSVNCRFKITDWMAFGVEAGYRFAVAGNNQYLTNAQLSAPFAGVNLFFGKMGFKMAE